MPGRKQIGKEHAHKERNWHRGEPHLAVDGDPSGSAGDVKERKWWDQGRSDLEAHLQGDPRQVVVVDAAALD